MADPSNFDMRDLFKPAAGRHIVFPDQDQESLEEEEIPIVYHVAKLNKQMAPRYDGSGSLGLERAEGFLLVEPDTEIPESLLTGLIYDGIEKKCEVLIVVAMYNEAVSEFKNTMCGITNNLKSFAKYSVDPNRIGCCLIVDGMKPLTEMLAGEENKENRNFFTQFYNDSVVKERFGVEDTLKCKIPNEESYDEFAHIFMQNVFFDPKDEFPLQFFFTVKQKNLRKLNTHLWFFGGFCEEIQPEYVVLLDVGTKPLKNSLFYMYEAMKLDPNLAGCCGEIRPMAPDIWKLVVPAQEVEYKFSHIFDKALESVIGYITVLPGAFSAYKWEALQGEPLWVDYFKSICHPEEMDPFHSNIYLAEDRVLCLSLVSKKGAAYTLRYIKKSVGETDVPDTIAKLMSQRRRWINGSWFALIDSLKHFKKIFRSNHTACRKTMFAAQMFYYYLSVGFSWFMVGSFYMVFAVTARSEWGGELGDAGNYLVLLYLVLLVLVYTLSLSVKPSRTNDLYKGIAAIFGIYMVLIFILVIKYLFVGAGNSSGDKNWAAYTIMMTFIMFGFNVTINCAGTVVLKGLVHFILMTPTYVNVFLIYSICNTHDCSWGNRPDVKTKEEIAKQDDFEEFRARWTIVWVLCNGGFGYLMLTLDGEEEGSGWYVYAIALTGTFILLLRTIGGTLHALQEQCGKKGLPKGQLPQREETVASPLALTRTLTGTRRGIVSPTSIPLSPIPNEPASDVSLGESELNFEETPPPQEGTFENSVESYEESAESRGSSLESGEESDTFRTESSAESAGDQSDSSEIVEHNSLSSDQEDIRDRVKSAREAMNMSLSFFAEQVGITSERLQQIEEGDFEPGPEELQQLLNAINNHHV